MFPKPTCAQHLSVSKIEPQPKVLMSDMNIQHPDRLLVNALLTTALLVALVMSLMSHPVLFMVGFAIAITINYLSFAEQKGRLQTHAGNILALVGLIFAAGVFTGVPSGTKMVDAMVESIIGVIPASLSAYLSIVTAVLRAPFTFFTSNDAFYFGVLPILGKAGAAYGVTVAEMGRASLVGQPVRLLSPLVPSTYLVVGLMGVDFDDHQRFTLNWALGTVVVLPAVGVVTAATPLVGQAIVPDPFHALH